MEILMDATRTYTAKARSQGKRVDDRTRESQQRLADKSFSDFVKRHNASLKQG